MQTTVAFLEHILPDEGYYVSHTVTPGNRFNRFHQSIPELADYLLAADAQGFTVYHGCASYRVNRNDPRGTPAASKRLGRTHHNVLWVSSLWGDVDAGPDKSYPHRDAALEAVWYFGQSTDLPPPTVVASGNGLHLYWPLDFYLRCDVWLQYATGLRALFNQKGLQVDQSRTCDASSILRTPGTHWRKQGEREVVCGTLNGPYGEELEFLKDVKSPGQPPKYVNGHRPHRLVADALVLFNNDKADGEAVANNCAQLGAMRASGGNVAEPVWYACLGVLAHCEDGARFGHAWSAGYDGYTEQETQTKLERAGAFGPTTCAKFAAVNAAGCAGCPYAGGKITSPIELGYNRQPPSENVPELERSENNQRSAGNTGTTGSNYEGIKLPDGFQWGKHGSLVAVSEHRNGAIIEHVISNDPLYISKLQEGEVRNEYSVTFKHFFTAKGWHDIIVDTKALLGTQATAELSNKGVVIHDEQNFKRYVRGHIDMIKQEATKLETRFDQFGWKDGGTTFLYGLNLYTNDGIKPAAGNPELEYRVRKYEVGVGPNAKLAIWSDTVNRLFAKGAEPQSVSMLASFGAPLMYHLDVEEGGAMLHYTTQDSAKGKTFALLGAISVWGRKWGVSSHSEDTKVSKGLTRGALSNLPVFNDELTLRDPEVIKAYIKSFTDGRDKLRGNSTGQLIHQGTEWHTILISASNQSIHSLLDDDAMRWRVIELDSNLPAEVRMAQGEDYKTLIREHSGIAGHVYLLWLTKAENLAWTKARLKEVQNTLFDHPRWGKPLYRYWIRTVTCMQVAGEICKGLGILNFDLQRVLLWLESRLPFEGGIPSRTWALESLSEYLRSEAKTGTLYMPGPWQPGNDPPPRPLQLPSRELLIRREDKGGRYYIAVKPFKDWLIKHDKNYYDLIKTLEGENIIIDKNRLITLGANSELTGPQVRCLIVNGHHPALIEIQPD